MKTALKAFFLSFLITFTFKAFGTGVEKRFSLQSAPSVTVVESKHKNLFVFKVSKELQGAMVELYFSNGDLVATKQLAKRKMVIDFCDVKPGVYTIKIKKNGLEEKLQYVRETR